MLSLKWRLREQPLKPVGLFVLEQHRLQAVRQLLALPDAQLHQLRGSSSDNALALLGAESDLPWIPGAIYVGQDEQAPQLLLPTQLHPPLPCDLLDEAICKQFGKSRWMVNPWQRQVYDISEALRLSRARLEQLL